MLVLIFKILLQVLTFGLALLLGGLDYWWHDKRTRPFKQARKAFIVLAVLSLLGSIGLTVFDDINDRQKERETREELSKVQKQNDGLQAGVAILSNKSSDILAEQRNSFLSVLGDQRKIGLDTASKIDTSANFLQSGIEQGIRRQENLLGQQQATLNNLTGGDSYCYLMLSNPGPNSAFMTVVHSGDYTLFDVTMELLDLDRFEETLKQMPSDVFRARKLSGRKIEPGNVSPGRALLMETVSLPPGNQLRLAIEIWARNGRFNEVLTLRKVNGSWKTAMKVERDNFTDKNPNATPTLLQQILDPQFPKDSKGQIQW